MFKCIFFLHTFRFLVENFKIKKLDKFKAKLTIEYILLSDRLS